MAQRAGIGADSSLEPTLALELAPTLESAPSLDLAPSVESVRSVRSMPGSLDQWIKFPILNVLFIELAIFQA